MFLWANLPAQCACPRKEKREREGKGASSVATVPAEVANYSRQTLQGGTNFRPLFPRPSSGLLFKLLYLLKLAALD